MRCYTNQLPASLQKGLAPFYLIFGEEPYQEAECVRQIKATAKQQGYDEVIKFNFLPGFDWQELLAQYNSMSLFSARTVIEFDLNQQKPGTAGGDAFKQLAQHINPDTVLIVKGQKAGQDIQRAAWFKALDKQGVFVPCYPLTGSHLHRWLDAQCHHLKLNLSPEAKRNLLEATEGNLLATSQELEKLSLLYASNPIDEQQVLTGLLNQSKFDIFDLNQATLSGQSEQVAKIMLKLASENVEPSTVIWALNKQLQTLINIKEGMLRGENLQALYKKNGVWKNQQGGISQTVNRLSNQQLEHIHQLLAQLDSGYKSAALSAPYQALLHVALSFCQPINVPLPITRSVQ